MKLLIFDIDGTLTATAEVNSVCYAQAIRDGLGISEFSRNWGEYEFVTDSGIADQISRKYRFRPLTDREDGKVQEALLSLLKEYPDDIYAEVPGASKFLLELNESSEFAVAIATGGWRQSALFKLEQAGINFSGIPVATASEALARDEIMRLARDQAMRQIRGKQIEEIIYFGDGVWDFHATSRLNWRMIGIGDRIEGLKGLGVKHVFRDFGNSSAILQALRESDE